MIANARKLLRSSGVTPLDAVGVPRKACSPAGPFLIKVLSSSGGDSQTKPSLSGLRLLLLTFRPLYIPPVEEMASWNDLSRGP